MKLFRAKPSEEITDNDLVAFHLHELSPAREQAVLRATEKSAFLAAESEAIGATLAAFTASGEEPMQIDADVLERSWAAIRPSLTPYAAPVPHVPRWRLPLLGAALAASAAVILVLRTHEPVRAPQQSLANSVVQRHVVPGPQPVPGNTPDGSLAGRPVVPHFGRSRMTRVLLPGPAVIGPGARLRASAEAPGRPPGDGLAPMPGTLPTAGVLMASAGDTGLPMAREEGADASGGMSAGWLGDGRGEPAGDTPGSAPGIAPGKMRPASRAKRFSEYRGDVMLGAGGNLTAKHVSVVAGSEQQTKSITPAVELQAAVHQQFRRALGYRITLTHSRPEFFYSYSGSNSTSAFSTEGTIRAHVVEAAGTYVVQGPGKGRVGTAGDVGAAVLAFLPTYPSDSVSYVYRPAGVLGVSLDYAVSEHWAVRAGYRAEVFKGPDFRYSGGLIPVSTSLTVGHHPSLGLVYRFGRKREEPKPLRK